MSVTIEEDLRAKRKGLLDSQRELVSNAEAADRDLTAEETQEFEKREADYDAITARIERMAKLESAAADPVDVNPAKREVVSNDPVEQGAVEIRAFEKVLRAKGNASGLDKEERTALAVGADGTGGITVPEEFEKTLLESMREWGVISQLARHISTGGGGDLTLPTVATNATASWETEASALDESEPTFGSVVLKAYKAANYAKVSQEMLDDSAFDILGFLAKNLGEGIGKLTGTAYASAAAGSTTSPQGLFNKAAVGKTAASNAAIVVSELFELYQSVIEPYRASASWVMNDATVATIRSFTEAVNGQFLWQPGLQAGTPDTLLGRPVYTDTNAPLATKNLVPIVFGDIARGYVIRDVQGIRVKVLDELFALNDQVGITCTLRTDGKQYDAAAVKSLQMGNA